MQCCTFLFFTFFFFFSPGNERASAWRACFSRLLFRSANNKVYSVRVPRCATPVCICVCIFKGFVVSLSNLNAGELFFFIITFRFIQVSLSIRDVGLAPDSLYLYHHSPKTLTCRWSGVSELGW